MPHIIHDETGVSSLSMTVAALIFDTAGRVLLIKENYGRRRYGPPGGRVEAGESPWAAVVREVREETGLQVRVRRVLGLYYFAAEPWLAFAFRCDIEQGNPLLPDTGEIAEIGWFDPDQLPTPLTILAPHVIPDAVRGEAGIVRDCSLP